MVTPVGLPVVTVGRDTTVRLPVAAGDFMIWMSCPEWLDALATPPHWQLRDLWELQKNDSVAITNRWDDLPPWFQLHPTECCNALAERMMAKLADGYEPVDPAEMDGPNLWRLRAGDRVGWVGEPRAGYEGREGILTIFDCQECALAFGDRPVLDLLTYISFGALSDRAQDPQAVALCRRSAEAIMSLGVPPHYLPEWEKWGLG